MLSNGFHQVHGRSHQDKQLDNDAANNHSANKLRGLRGQSYVNMADQLVWMTFRTEFTIPSNGKLIIEGLSKVVNETWQDNERITQQNHRHNDDHQRKLLEISKQNPGASGWPHPRHDNANHQKIKQAHHCKPDKLLQDEFVQSRSSH